MMLLMWKWMGLFLKEKLSFKMLWLSFSFKLDFGFYIVSNAKTAYKKIEALVRSMKFVSPGVALFEPRPLSGKGPVKLPLSVG